MSNLFQLRLAKIFYSVTHPKCWKALQNRVAPSIEHREVIQSLEPECLLDVGANRGQFSLMTRVVHPTIPIYAFEPLPSEGAVYQRLFKSQPKVKFYPIALGEKEGIAEIHLSRRADSSSILPIGELQCKLFPSTDEVGTVQIRMGVLDKIPEAWSAYRRCLLKLDVQGFELAVLRGSSEALKHCAYVYAECSDVPLYTGQALYPDVAEFLKREGFLPTRRANEQIVDGKLIQADYLFTRT